MKLFYLILTVCVSFSNLNAQDTIIIYYDSNWDKTTIENAKYYRKAFEVENQKWQAIDYYLPSNTIQMKGSYLSDSMEVKDGKFDYFYDNGKLDRYGNYKNNKRTGEWSYFHKNGEDAGHKLYDNLGSKTGDWISYYKNGTTYYEGAYLNDKKNGIWKWYYKVGRPSSIEEYVEGELKKVQFYTIGGTKQKGKAEIESKPKFKGGIDKLIKYLSKTIKYPIEAQSLGVEGRVRVKFVVDTDGSITNVSIVESLGYGCDIEAARVVENMPNWEPGKQHNLPIKVYYTLPIKFSLE